MSKSIIYYNPKCSKCRQTKSILDEKKIDTTVIDYLNTVITAEDLKHIISMGISAKNLVRSNQDEWPHTGLDLDTATDEEIINAIIQFPILLQRPIVLINDKAVISRPPEKVLEIL